MCVCQNECDLFSSEVAPCPSERVLFPSERVPFQQKSTSHMMHGVPSMEVPISSTVHLPRERSIFPVECVPPPHESVPSQMKVCLSHMKVHAPQVKVCPSHMMCPTVQVTVSSSPSGTDPLSSDMGPFPNEHSPNEGMEVFTSCMYVKLPRESVIFPREWGASPT